ncbi:MAG TPA: NUDIX domain-containing protein [Candidatus Eisenbacteria bacterium]|nr:NUDIX domain-containing protein [Candidatus Eisenbacteria bacterium]
MAARSESVRTVLLTPAGTVLLMKIAGRRGDIWITPGGRIRPGEEPLAALKREVAEETGLTGFRVEAEIWVRHATFVSNGVEKDERERFFLVPSERFEPATSNLEPDERAIFQEFRWWPIEEIARSKERFAPRRLGELLQVLQRDGPPSSPVETWE